MIFYQEFWTEMRKLCVAQEVLNSRPFYLSLSNAEITGTHHHSWILFVNAYNTLELSSGSKKKNKNE